LQSGTVIPLLTRGRYALSSALDMDVSASAFRTRTNFSGTTNLVHGTIMVRRFPSYVLYGTADIGSGLRTTIPNYFANASTRNLIEIAIGQTDLLRQLRW
jgi:hypothetical protein